MPGRGGGAARPRPFFSAHDGRRSGDRARCDDAVTVSDIIANLVKNAENACKVVAAAVAAMPESRECKCGSALSHAIITDRATIPEHTKKKLGLLIGKYLP